MRIVLIAFALCLFPTALRPQDTAPADSLALGWSTTLDELKAPARFVAVCPSAGEPQGTIWGTDVYTSDSSICHAAIHAGALGPDGNPFEVEVAAGQPEYVGTTRNGITSLSYPSWGRSFRFPGATGATPSASSGGPVVHDFQGDWSATAQQSNARVGARVRFTCAPGGAGGSVWGTDTYTDDSSICEAAVHAGMITRAKGGTVLFDLLGAQPSFTGTQRNGVTTMSYPSWPGSFRFVAPEAAASAQP